MKDKKILIIIAYLFTITSPLITANAMKPSTTGSINKDDRKTEYTEKNIYNKNEKQFSNEINNTTNDDSTTNKKSNEKNEKILRNNNFFVTERIKKIKVKKIKFIKMKKENSEQSLNKITNKNKNLIKKISNTLKPKQNENKIYKNKSYEIKMNKSNKILPYNESKINIANTNTFKLKQNAEAELTKRKEDSEQSLNKITNKNKNLIKKISNTLKPKQNENKIYKNKSYEIKMNKSNKILPYNESKINIANTNTFKLKQNAEAELTKRNEELKGNRKTNYETYSDINEEKYSLSISEKNANIGPIQHIPITDNFIPNNDATKLNRYNEFIPSDEIYSEETCLERKPYFMNPILKYLCYCYIGDEEKMEIKMHETISDLYKKKCKNDTDLKNIKNNTYDDKEDYDELAIIEYPYASQ